MLFRNLVCYALPTDWRLSPLELEEALERRPLAPCAGFELQTRGFVSPGYEDRALHSRDGEHLLAMGLDQKLLPATVVRQETLRRADALAAEQGHPVGRRQLRELKARVTDELLARALTRQRTVEAWLSPARGWCVVNAASPARAEELVDLLRDTLGSFAALRLEAAHAPAAVMASWLRVGDAPGRFRLDEDLELRATDGGAAVRWVRHPLDGDEIRAHLEAGKLPTRLGLVWHDRIAFVLEQDLTLRRVRFLDVYDDASTRAESPHEQFDVDFALMTGELGQLLEELLEALGGAAGEADARPPLAAAG